MSDEEVIESIKVICEQEEKNGLALEILGIISRDNILARAAQKASLTGNREDLREFLRLRRSQL